MKLQKMRVCSIHTDHKIQFYCTHDHEIFCSLCSIKHSKHHEHVQVFDIDRHCELMLKEISGMHEKIEKNEKLIKSVIAKNRKFEGNELVECFRTC